MPTVIERNEEAFKRMKKESFEKRQTQTLNMNQVIDLTKSVVKMKDYLQHDKHNSINDDSDLLILTLFMAVNIDWSNYDEPENIIPRFEAFKLERGEEACLRQWRNKYEMGK